MELATEMIREQFYAYCIVIFRFIDDGLVRPFGDIEVATAEVLVNSLEMINLRAV